MFGEDITYVYNIKLPIELDSAILLFPQSTKIEAFARIVCYHCFSGQLTNHLERPYNHCLSLGNDQVAARSVKVDHSCSAPYMR